MTTLTIGKVAKAAGLGVETVRFYERQGLIAEPARSDSGYRQYGPETIRRLQFIVRAKALGFTLQEIGDLLDLRATPGAGCADVQARAEAKIADIEERITQLDAMKRALGELVVQCRGEGPLSDPVVTRWHTTPTPRRPVPRRRSTQRLPDPRRPR